MGTVPVAATANTYISDLPDYVKPYYQMLLNATAGMTYDPQFVQDQMANANSLIPATGIPSGSPGAGGPTSAYPPDLGSIVGRPNLITGYQPSNPNLPGGSSGIAALSGTRGLMPNLGTAGMASTSFGVNGTPGRVQTLPTGVGSPAPGATNYNPGPMPPVAYPTPIPQLPNGQGAIGYGPGSPSTSPGAISGVPPSVTPPLSTGIPPAGTHPAPITSPAVPVSVANAAQSSSQFLHGWVDPNSYWSQTGKANPYAISSDWTSQSAAQQVAKELGGKVIDNSQSWSASGNPFPVPVNMKYTVQIGGKNYIVSDLANALTNYSPDYLRVYLNQQGITSLGAAPTGSTTAYQSAYDLNPAAKSPGAAPASAPTNSFVVGPTTPLLPTTRGVTDSTSSRSTAPGLAVTRPGMASGGILHLDTGGTTTNNGTPLQGSYPMAAYTPYQGQRILDPTGMFGFDPTSTDYSLSTPTQFAENQTYNLFSNNGNGISQNPLAQAQNYVSDTYDRSYDAVKNAENQYGSLLANPLQSTYNPMQFDAGNINVDPYTQYQTANPMSVSPDLSAFSSQNTPQVNQYPAIAYGVNPGQWTDNGVASQYMSPYTQQVNDAQQALINRNFDEQLAANHANAATAGAFGGTRQAVQDSLSNRDRQMQLDAVAAQNLNNAYNSGMGQFNQDRGAIMQAGAYGLQADTSNQNAAMQAQLANQQALLQGRNQAAGYDLQAQLANQQAGLNSGQFNASLANTTQNQQAQAMLQAALANQSQGLQAQGMTNQSNLTADQQRMAAWLNNQNALNANQQTQQGLLGLMSGQSGNLGNVLNLQQQMQLQQLGAIQNVGQTEDQRRQAILDMGYQNFTNQQNWPYQLANFQSGILRGVPTAVNQEAVQYQSYNPAAQWAGLGIAGLGASSGVGGGYGLP